MSIKNGLLPARRPAFVYALTVGMGLSLLTTPNSFAQSNTNSGGTNNSPIFTVVEQSPEFVGGLNALLDYLRKNLL